MKRSSDCEGVGEYVKKHHKQTPRTSTTNSNKAEIKLAMTDRIFGKGSWQAGRRAEQRAFWLVPGANPGQQIAPAMAFLCKRFMILSCIDRVLIARQTSTQTNAFSPNACTACAVVRPTFLSRVQKKCRCKKHGRTPWPGTPWLCIYVLYPWIGLSLEHNHEHRQMPLLQVADMTDI